MKVQFSDVLVSSPTGCPLTIKQEETNLNIKQENVSKTVLKCTTSRSKIKEELVCETEKESTSVKSAGNENYPCKEPLNTEVTPLLNYIKTEDNSTDPKILPIGRVSVTPTMLAGLRTIVILCEQINVPKSLVERVLELFKKVCMKMCLSVICKSIPTSEWNLMNCF